MLERISPKLLNWHHQRHPCSDYIINEPLSQQSIKQLEFLTSQIVEPLEKEFNQLTVTYGFTSFELLRYIKKNSPGQMAPELDQHAAHELNSYKKRICKRNGASCDIKIGGISALILMRYIYQHLPFDRIYFYGEEHALHVSVSPEPKREIWKVKHGNGKPPTKIKSPNQVVL